MAIAEHVGQIAALRDECDIYISSAANFDCVRVTNLPIYLFHRDAKFSSKITPREYCKGRLERLESDSVSFKVQGVFNAGCCVNENLTLAE